MSLFRIKLTDDDLVHLAGFSELQKLDCNGTAVSDAGLVHLKGLTSLQDLDLMQTKVTDTGLANLKELTKLRLSFTTVTDKGIASVQGLANLQELSLFGTKISNDGLLHLKKMSKLEVLILRFTKIGDAGLVHLAGLKTLKTLNLQSTKVADTGVRKLQTALPKCKIVRRRSTCRPTTDSTIRKRCGFAKQFFAFAVKRELLPRNPFDDLKSSAVTNPRRQRFVTQAEIQQVIEATVDIEWQLIFALARFGGLRVPSEIEALQWQDIDWANGRLVVWSRKTEHHAGGESRTVPIFAELRPYLEAAFDSAADGDIYVIERHRQSAKNWRTHACRLIRRAGLAPWPKLFVNLRVSRATELAERFPAHVATAWMGHTQQIAEQHYWTTTQEHFDRAATESTAVQNPVQQPAVLPRKNSQSPKPKNEKTPALQGFATHCDVVHMSRVEDRGLEPLTS